MTPEPKRTFCVSRKTDVVIGEILTQGLSADEAESHVSADPSLVILALEPAGLRAGSN